VIPFDSKRLPEEPDAIAPDGSAVRVLLGVERGGLAHFQLAPGQTSRAVAHKTVDEIWYFVQGHGEMWLKTGEREEVVVVDPGLCVTIPVGTHFQFRALGMEPLAAVGVTMPPWPGASEAYHVEGPWR
jgi:mannose-6-phosphate isomerase-like protein (cupin superfamily)